jgi:hypothetical protein
MKRISRHRRAGLRSATLAAVVVHNRCRQGPRHARGAAAAYLVLVAGRLAAIHPVSVLAAASGVRVTGRPIATTQSNSMAHVVALSRPTGRVRPGPDDAWRFRTGKVESKFDPELRGQPGTIKYEVDAHGRVVRELGATPSVRGKDMALTIDQELQAIALKRIEGLRVASIVVLDAVTGAILVMASYPTFDPNDVSFRVNLDRWKELARHKDHPLENRALRGVYPPGSTYKVVTALAGLEAGVITQDERMNCPGAYIFARHRFRCWKRHGGGSMCIRRQAIRDVYF